MTNSLHAKQTPNEGIHGIVATECEDAAARLSLSGFKITDRNKVFRQMDDDSLWILLEHNPITWSPLAQAEGGGGGSLDYINVSAGTTNQNLTRLGFVDSPTVSFGLSGTNITASVAPSVGGGVAVGAAGGTATSGTVVFSNSNSVSFGYNNGTITASIPSIPSTAGLISGINVSASNSSANQTGLTFQNSNGASFGLSDGAITMSYTVPTVPSQTSLNYSNANNVSFGQVGSTLTASASFPTQTQFVLSNSNGLAWTTNGSTVVGSYSQAAQTNQSLGIYGSSQTVGQSSSSTVDARSLTFQGMGNVSVGLSGGKVLISAPTQTAQTFIGGIQDAANTITSGTIRLSNVNGISFGVNGQTITASHNGITSQTVQTQNVVVPSAGTQTATSGTVVWANSNGISFGMSGSSQITASYTVPNVPAQTNQTLGGYAVGNTTGQSSSSTFDARTLSFRGAGGASVGYSNGSIVIDVNTAGGGALTNINVSAGTTSGNLSALTFANGGNVSFGLNAGTITATVPTQTAYVFSQSNGLTFGTNGSTVTASYTVPTQSAQSMGLYGLGNTTQNSSTTRDARSLSFNALGGMTVGYSNGSIQLSAPGTSSLAATGLVSISENAGTISIGVPQQSIGFYGVGNTTQSSSTLLDLRTVSFNGLGGMTVGYSNGSIQLSAPTTANLISRINVSAGTTSGNVSALTFGDANGLAFGLNAGTITGSYTVPTQSAQTMGIYGSSNTAGQSSSSTVDARSLSFQGFGNVSVGLSAGRVVVSGTQSVQTQGMIQAVYDGANSISSGTIRFSNSNGISWGVNAQVITASHNGITSQTNQTIGAYGVSNTTLSTSGTIDARSLSFQGAGIASVGVSNGSVVISVPTGAPSPVNFSAGTTSGNLGSVVFSNGGGVSFGLNGATITASAAGGGGGGTLSLFATGNTTQNSSTSLNVSSVLLNAIGGMTAGYSNGSIQLSAPPVSSLVGSAGFSLSTNGSTISMGPVFASRYMNENAMTTQGTAQGNSLVSVFPVIIPFALSASQFYFGASIGLTTQTNTSSAFNDCSASAVLYTRNGSTLSSIGSGSNSFTTFWRSNSTSSVAGPRPFNIPLTGQNTFAPGEYWVALHVSTNNSATGGANTTALGAAYSMILGAPVQSSALGMVSWGQQSSVSGNGASIGLGLVSTGATMGTLAFSNISQNLQSGHLAKVWADFRNWSY